MGLIETDLLPLSTVQAIQIRIMQILHQEELLQQKLLLDWKEGLLNKDLEFDLPLITLAGIEITLGVAI